MPQGVGYTARFPDGTTKVYPPTTDPKVRAEQAADLEMELKKRTPQRGPNPLEGIGLTIPPVQGRADLRANLPPRAAGEARFQTTNLDLPIWEEDPLETVGELLQIGLGATPLGQSARAPQLLKNLTKPLASLPRRILGTGAGGAVEAVGRGEDPVSGGVVQALMEGLFGTGKIPKVPDMARPGGEMLRRPLMNLGAGIGGVSPDARRMVVDAHIAENLPLGASDRPILPWAPSLSRLTDETGKRIQGLERRVPGTTPASRLVGSVNSEVTKPETEAFSRAATLNRKEMDRLAQMARVQREPGGRSSLTGRDPDELQAVVDEIAQTPYKQKHRQLQTTPMSAHDLGDLGRRETSRAQDLIRARLENEAKYVEDNSNEVVSAALGKRAKRLRDELASREGRIKALTVPRDKKVTGEVVPDAPKRRQLAEPPSQKALPPGEDPLLLGEGTTLPAPVPKGGPLSQRRREPALKPRGSEDPGVVEGRVLPKQAGPDPDEAKFGDLYDQIKAEEKRYSNLRTIKETREGMRGKGALLTDLGLIGMRGGLGAGGYANVVKALGGTTAGIGGGLVPLLSLGLLSPKALSKLGFTLKKYANAAPTLVRLTEPYETTMEEEKKAKARRRKPE